MASILKEICPNVCKEPPLQPLTGELMNRSASTEDGARLDVAVEGFWGYLSQRVFFDIRVFSPLVWSYQDHSLGACYKRNEEEKKCRYNQRVREIEHSSFSSLIFSTSRGMGPIATLFLKQAATLHSAKSQKSYSVVMNFLRCRLSFSLLRSTIRCL